MKKNLLKIFAFCAMATAFVACSDDNDGVGSGYPIAGTYVTSTREVSNPDINGGEVQNMNFVMDFKWKEGVNMPTVGGFMPASSVISLMNAMVSQLVAGGLQEFTLAPNGAIKAKYKDIKMKGTDTGSILGSLMQPEFLPEVKDFPSAETDAVIPANAVAYEANASMMYFRLSKKFIDEKAAADMGPNFSKQLAKMIADNKLPIKTTGDYFGIPLKYTVNGNQLDIYIDRDMALPYLPILQVLKGVVPPVSAMGMQINVPELIESVINASESFKITFPLEKK